LVGLVRGKCRLWLDVDLNMTKFIIRGHQRIRGTICPLCSGDLAIAPTTTYDLHQKIWHTDKSIAAAARKYIFTAIVKRNASYYGREYEHGTWQD